MAKILRVVTAEQKELAKRQEAERLQQKEELKRRFSQKTQLSQANINELVVMLAREHGLIE